MPISTCISCHRSALSAATAALALSSVFFASPLSADNMSVDATSDSTIEEVIVQAHPLSAEGLARGTVSVTGDTLNRNLAPNLGDVLANQPGIHSASFGAAVGRPIIHGLGGARVQVMEDRLSTMDVSVTSGDQHAVAARLDGEGEGFAWHIDGFDRRSTNYDIPGETESDALIAAEEAEGGEHDEEASPGFLPGSHFSTDGGAIGFSFTGENWFSGIAVSQLNAVTVCPAVTVIMTKRNMTKTMKTNMKTKTTRRSMVTRKILKPQFSTWNKPASTSKWAAQDHYSQPTMAQ